ncbi:MAG: hypothetical protein ACRELE_11810, partial [Gemmatimonadales bacterium]
MTRHSVGNRIACALAAGISALMLASGLAGCGSNLPTSSTPVTPPPSDGWLTVQLTTPHTNDGAVQFQISGPAIDSAAVSGYDGFATVTGGVADLIVTGSVASGTVALVHVRNLALSGQ